MSLVSLGRGVMTEEDQAVMLLFARLSGIVGKVARLNGGLENDEGTADLPGAVSAAREALAILAGIRSGIGMNEDDYRGIVDGYKGHVASDAELEVTETPDSSIASTRLTIDCAQSGVLELGGALFSLIAAGQEVSKETAVKLMSAASGVGANLEMYVSSGRGRGLVGVGVVSPKVLQ